MTTLDAIDQMGRLLERLARYGYEVTEAEEGTLEVVVESRDGYLEPHYIPVGAVSALVDPLPMTLNELRRRLRDHATEAM